jgi:response regulator RpfG family c-di-GMP phosphodiesterase
LGLLDETRKRIADEAAEGVATMEEDLRKVGKELKYTQGVVAGELSAFQAEHSERARQTIKKFIESQVEVEKARLRGMQRALGLIRIHGQPNVPIPRRRKSNEQEA